MVSKVDNHTIIYQSLQIKEDPIDKAQPVQALASGILKKTSVRPATAPSRLQKVVQALKNTTNHIICKIWLILLKVFPSLANFSVPFENNKIREIQIKSYLNHFEHPNADSAKLDKIYRNLSSEAQAKIPLPYGKNVQNDTYKVFGAHVTAGGTQFSVLAPHAKYVELRLINDDESIDQNIPMARQANGQWTFLAPSVKAGQKYQYIVNGQVKIDPYSFSQSASKTLKAAPYSVVADRTSYQWKDAAWLDKRASMANKPQPMNTYEVLLSTWKTPEGTQLSCRELATQLADYCKKMGYTHVELMGALDYMNDKSWGYQVTSFFAPNHRLGNADDFKFLVDTLHQNNIAVIIDWIPNHFSKKSYGLDKFDGTNQYQNSFLKNLFSVRNYFFRWGSRLFDFKNKLARDFLISSASYWIKEMHVDGLRVDAVKAVAYDDGFKKVFNKDKGGNDGILFLRDLNTVIHKDNPGVVTIAEDYDCDPKDTRPISKGGYGFDLSWNIGWMHHTTNFFSSQKKSINEIQQAIFCPIDQKGVIMLSHDEAGHDKLKKIYHPAKVPEETRCAYLRLMMTYMMCLPGKKLSFMGNEFGGSVEWAQRLKKNLGLNWDELNNPNNQKLSDTIQAINTLYIKRQAFWEKDDGSADAQWFVNDNSEKNLLAYRRLSSSNTQATCLHNFSPDKTIKTLVPLTEDQKFGPGVLTVKETFNSDESKFGGNNGLNDHIEVLYNFAGKPICYYVNVPPLSTVVVDEVKSG